MNHKSAASLWKAGGQFLGLLEQKVWYFSKLWYTNST